MQRLHALFVLAWALVRTLLARMLGAEAGVSAFRANYDADRLPPATVEERALLSSMTGCIACGLCDVSSPLGAPSSHGAGPMDLALASSRMASDADAAVLGLVRLSDEVLSERERICPGHVPLVAIARLTRARAAEVGG